MNSNERELQESIEGGNPTDGNAVDIIAYEKLFRALRVAPKISLSESFADHLVSRIMEKQKREDVRDHFWFGAGVIFLIGLFIATIVYTGFKVNLGFLKNMSAYTGLFVFGVSFISILNWLDKRILSSKKTH